MRKDPDFPGVDIRNCRVLIHKWSTVLVQEHCEGDQLIIDSNSEGEADFPGLEERDLSLNILKSIIDSNSEGEAHFPGLEERNLSVNIGKSIIDFNSEGEVDFPGLECTNVSLEEQVQDEESTVCAEENCEDEQGIANSSMESVNLILPTPLNCPVPLVAEDTVRDSASHCGPLLDLSDTEVEAKMERFGNVKVTDPVAQSDEVSDKNYQF